MIVEGLAIAALAKTFYDVNESSKMDAQALKKYAKAFERQEEAELLVRQKAEFMDKRLANVAKKKRAIVKNSVPKFIEVYSKIQKIELENKSSVNDIVIKDNIQKMSAINCLSIAMKKDLTDKELVCGWLTKGLGEVMKMDSERYLSAANSTMRAANVAYSQSESKIGRAHV